MSEKPTYLVLSYFPLLDAVAEGYNPGDALTIDEFQSKLFKHYDDEGLSKIEACMWIIDDKGDLCPVFSINKAHEIYQHLVAWSEADHEDWFELQIKKYDNRYGIILISKPEKSIERWKMARMVNHEEFVINCDFKVLTEPLQFVSSEGGTATYDQVKDKIGESLQIYFIEHDTLMQYSDDPSKVGDEAFIDVGRFPVCNKTAYLDEMMRDQK